ncbi:hypothetical protein MIND_00358100 [Mycena indigotica]|uniref:F-box domain-containing protein n=1 Tax=Mycena indigotica TaxID=2126181 RepID=A0A8H6T0T2_9AGAR|nr:uncharacterized protein MIND_00358100 [Mycena indigotica]KAF7309860.1 hypothetical protein MIND_00358100 [Mycena indigotica]
MSFERLAPELVDDILAHASKSMPPKRVKALRTVCHAFEAALAPRFFAALTVVLGGSQRDMLEAVARGQTGWTKHTRTLKVVVKRSKANMVPLVTRVLNALPEIGTASLTFNTLSIPRPALSVIFTHLARSLTTLHITFKDLADNGINWHAFTCGPAWPRLPLLHTLRLSFDDPQQWEYAGSDICDALLRADSTRDLTTLHVYAPHPDPDGFPGPPVQLSAVYDALGTPRLKHVTLPPGMLDAVSLRDLTHLAVTGKGELDPAVWTALADARARITELRLPVIGTGLGEYLETYSGLEVLVVDLDYYEETATLDMRLLTALTNHAATMRVLAVRAQYGGCWSFGPQMAGEVSKLVNLRVLVASVDIDRVPWAEGMAPAQVVDNAVEHFATTMAHLPHLNHAALLQTLGPGLHGGRDSGAIMCHEQHARRAIEDAFDALPLSAAVPGRVGPVVFAARALYHHTPVDGGMAKWEVLQQITRGKFAKEAVPAFARI